MTFTLLAVSNKSEAFSPIEWVTLSIFTEKESGKGVPWERQAPAWHWERQVPAWHWERQAPVWQRRAGTPQAKLELGVPSWIIPMPQVTEHE